MVKSAPDVSTAATNSTALRAKRRRLMGWKSGGRVEQNGAESSKGVTFDMTGKPAQSFPKVRMRRMRRDEFSRRLMRETRLTVDSLIYPVFVVEGSGQRQSVASMPGIERYSVDELVRECESVVKLKIPAVALFPFTDSNRKTLDGRES